MNAVTGCFVFALLCLNGVKSTTLKFGVSLGLCPPKIVSCQCGGKDGYKIDFEIKQCKHIGILKFKCDNCNREPSVSERCSVYEHCFQCDTQSARCSSCKHNRYGSTCAGECNCQNGGVCDRNTGRCICNNGFEGKHCEKKPGCPPPPSIRNGRPVDIGTGKEPISKGLSATYVCKDGYVIQGTETIYCQHDGKWSHELPVCVRSCPMITQFLNGKIHYEHEKQMIRYECDHGYGLIGKAIRKCGQDSVWSGQEPKCVKVTACEEPKAFQNGRVDLQNINDWGSAPGSVAKFTCDRDYSLIGDDQSICGDDGTWSSAFPQCVLQENICPPPGDFSNGEMSILGPGGDLHFPPGTKVKFTCKPLHYLVGDAEITCKYNGLWSGFVPMCVEVTTCSSIENIPKGRLHMISPDTSSESNSRILPLPSTNSTTVISSRVPLRSDIPSPDLPPDLRSARLKLKLPRGRYHVGTRASFSCESRYYELVGSKSRTCQQRGTWSGSQPICVPVCGQSSEPLTPLITHGVPSKEGQWPWQVGIARRLLEGDPLGEWFIQCGGSLINEEWVLTAAHCFIENRQLIPLDDIRLYFGKYFRNDSQDDPNVQIRHVAELHVHPDFEPLSFDSDIALVRVTPEIRFNSRVQPVCLPNAQDAPAKEGDLGVVSGWGRMEDGEISWILQHTQLPIVDRDTCESEYRKQNIIIRVTSNMMCAGFAEGKRDTCNGDSGGPFVFATKGQNNRWVLEGITSWGRGDSCGLERNYSGYVRVRQFLSWIENII